jgi:hypothetical protein
MTADSQAAGTQNADRSQALYDQLAQRASQSLAIDRNDPIIRAQADAYGAQQERARRDSLADYAESAGPTANIRGEQRLGYERMGSAVGGFEAELLGRELESRRAEITQALNSMGSLLSADQQRELQRQIALLDQAVAQQQLTSSNAGREQEWQTALLQNEQFLKDLGLRAEDRASYYDAVRRGYFRAEG